MGQAEGFTFEQRKSGDVVIRHHGKIAATLRGRQAERFIAATGRSDPQQLMARYTGNYKRGNERRG